MKMNVNIKYKTIPMILKLFKVAPYNFKQNTIETTLTLIYLIISCVWNV